MFFTFCNLLLLQDPHAEEFEDKEWTFVIENVSERHIPSVFLPRCIIIVHEQFGDGRNVAL